MMESCKSCEYRKTCVYHNTLDRKYCKCYSREQKKEGEHNE